MPRRRPSVSSAKELDDLFLDHRVLASLTPHMFSWCRTVRQALGLPITTLASRLGVSKQAASKLELGEQAGTISLNKLEDLASALDCRLIYGFVPNTSLRSAAERLNDSQMKARRQHRVIPQPD